MGIYYAFIDCPQHMRLVMIGRQADKRAFTQGMGVRTIVLICDAGILPGGRMQRDVFRQSGMVSAELHGERADTGGNMPPATGVPSGSPVSLDASFVIFPHKS